MEQTPPILMARAGKIIRRSIHTLLKDFHYFTSHPVILMLPFSASFLFSRYLYYCSCSQTKSFHVLPIVVPFPNQNNLSHVIFSFIIIFPFAISSFAMGKASIIQYLNHHKPNFSLSFSTWMPLWKTLVSTYLCNIALLITIDKTSSFLMFFVSKENFGFLSNYNKLFTISFETIFYVIYTNTMVISNLALVLSGMTGFTGWKAIHKACLLRKHTNYMSLLLYLPTNMGLTAIEALFWYRIISSRDDPPLGRTIVSLTMEGLLIAYLYSIVIVLETIACCLFAKEYESSYGRHRGAEIEHITRGADGYSERLEEIL